MSEIVEQYRSGHWDQSLKLLQATPSEDAAYYYDLGTVYYRLGNLASAVAYLEKAQKIAPGDRDVAWNLKQARSALSAQIGVAHLDPGASWTDEWAENLPLVWLESGFGILALVFWISHLRNAAIWKRVAATATGVLGLGVLILDLLASNHSALIALENRVIRSGPAEQYTELSRVEPGTKLRPTGSSEIAKDKQVWIQVRYSDDGLGWVLRSGLI